MPLGAARFGLLGGVADLGKLELIETQTVSGVSTVDFTSLGSYNVHFLTANNFHTTADSGRGVLRFYESGVLESAGVYQVAEQQGRADGVFAEVRSTTSTSLRYIISTGNATNESGNAYCYIYNAGNSSKYTFMSYQSMAIQAIPQAIMAFGSGVLPQASAVDGFQISGTGISGVFSLYGIAES
jgi:hypothetical protein